MFLIQLSWGIARTLSIRSTPTSLPKSRSNFKVFDRNIPFRLFCSSTPNQSSSSQSNIISKADLSSTLKAWRKRTSDELQVPIYKVLNNKAIDLIVENLPQSLAEFRVLYGIGDKKTEKFGPKIVDIVRRFLSGELLPADRPHEVHVTAEDRKFLQETAELAELEKKKKSLKAKKKKLSENKKPRKKGDESTHVMSSEELELYKQSLRAGGDSVVTFEDLNEEKQEAAKKILQGQNVFITGAAGTGKSFLLKYLTQELVARHGVDNVAITAPTGIAAINIAGQTINSFAGIGLGKGDPERVKMKVLSSTAACERWLRCKVLIIDEISMLNKDLFELLDNIARSVRDTDLPMGGIQVILVGDFLQLPPVSKGTEKSLFCFQSDLWEALGLHLRSGSVHLKKVERQEDELFVTYLNQARVGLFTKDFQRDLDRCLVGVKPLPVDGILPTKLYAVNKEVDEENLQQLAELPGEVVTLQAVDKFSLEKTLKVAEMDALRAGADTLIPSSLDMKVGAQVMLLRNRSKMTSSGYSSTTTSSVTSSSLVNGSRGKIIAFSESVSKPGLLVPTVKFDNGLTITLGYVDFVYSLAGLGSITRSQIPLKLAWAATIHKSQGTTLTRAELQLSQAFDFGQGYVALSRVRSLDGLWLSSRVHGKLIKAHPAVLAFYESSSGANSS